MLSRELIVCILSFLDPVIICESEIELLQQILHGEKAWLDRYMTETEEDRFLAAMLE